MTVKKVLGVLWLVAGLIALGHTSVASADRSFTPRFSTNDTGNITIAANAVLTCNATPPASGASSCSGARNGGAGDNNAFAMIGIDADSDPTTARSSSATVTVPAGSEILFAGLYWGGSTGNLPASSLDDVKLKAPGAASYTRLTATTLDTVSGAYQGFRDVTSLVKAAGAGVYSVGDVQTSTGAGAYGGWSLVVAYRNVDEPARNLTIFDGFDIVNTGAPITVPVSGFKTPPTGAVKTSMGFIGYDGDRGLTGDSLRLNDTVISDAASPGNNPFNSTISTYGAPTPGRGPAYANTLGYDADLYRVDGVLGNGVTSANIRVSTASEVFMPGVITFATELYAPKVTQTKDVVDLNGGDVRQGDVLEYVIEGRNDGLDAAVGFTVTDPIPAGTTYVPGSLRTTTGAGGPTGTWTDADDTDQGEFDAAADQVVVRLGSGANGTSGGQVLGGGTTYEARFRVRVDSGLPNGTKLNNTATANFFGKEIGTPLTAKGSAEAQVVASPNLRLKKTRTSGTIVPGQPASWDIDVDNHGQAPTDGNTVTVVDTLPSSLRAPIDASGTGWDCTVAGRTITCTRDDVLAIGAAYPPIELTAQVDPGATGVLENTANVGGGGDASPEDNSDSDTSPADPRADLAIDKSAPAGPYIVGDTITYTLRATNRGPSTATSVGLTDVTPQGLDITGVTSTQGTCTDVVVCDLGRLAPNATATVTVRAKVLPSAAGTSVTNRATVKSELPDPDPTNDEDEVTVTIGGADLAVTKVADPGPLTPGGPIGWTITVTNDGPSPATGVAVRDTLPGGVSGATASVTTGTATCDVAGGAIDCAAATLAPGASIVIRVTGTIDPTTDGRIVNRASVKGNEPDPDPTNDEDEVPVDVESSADLSIVKSARGGVGPGDSLTYTLTVENDGPSNATGVTITDALPAGVTFTSASGGCTVAAGTVTCPVGALAKGASASREITVRVDANATGSIANTAKVDGDQPDPDPTDDEDTTTTQVYEQGNVKVTKTTDATSSAAGDIVTYEILVDSTGPLDSDDVVVTDALPAGLTYVGDDAGCTAAGGTLRCELGTMAADTSRTITVTARVQPFAVPADDHTHDLTIQKVEEQVDLDPGQTRTVTLSCPSGYLMTDGSPRIDAVDQNTGTPISIEVLESRSTATGAYTFTVRNTATGRAQTKVFGTCLPLDTSAGPGAQHPLVAGGPVSASAALTPGRRDVVVACGGGLEPVAPGFVATGGVARLVGSEVEGSSWRFTFAVEDDATDVTASVRCLQPATAVADGHSHALDLTHVVRKVTVPAGQTIDESVICGDNAKGITATWDLAPGLVQLGNDPQPKSRVFRLHNPTGSDLEATIDLTCIEARTGGAVAPASFVNTAQVSTSTPETSTADNTSTATSTRAGGAAAPGPAPAPAPRPAPNADPAGTNDAPVAPDAPVPPSGAPVTPPPAPAPAMRLGVSSVRATASALQVGVACSGSCSGSVVVKLAARTRLSGTVRKAGTVLGRVTFRRPGTVTVKLTRTKIRALKRAKVRKVVVELRLKGKTVRKTVALR